MLVNAYERLPTTSTRGLMLRGMDWVGRQVFEHWFWKGADDRRAELEVLDKMEAITYDG